MEHRPLISIEGLARRFGDSSQPAVFEDIWFGVDKGEFCCLIGHSGCGKTTILNVLAGLDSPSEGAVIVDNREIDGPSLLVSTECGGEGRNFEFCRRLVLFDLPWKPSVVEQRIGRLDRIGRRIPVEVVYFRPPTGLGRDVVRLFEGLGLFREPLAGLETQLAHVQGALE